VDPSKYTALFVSESREHIQQCNTHLLAWERDPAATEPLQGLFRSVHTLKGMAAAMGFARLAELAHAFEHVLTAVRESAVAPSAELVALGFDAVDRLEHGVARAVAGEDAALDVEPLRTRLTEASRPPATPRGRRAARRPAPDARSAPSGGVAVRVRLRPGTPLAGARATLVLGRAELLGQVSEVVPPAASWMTDAFDGAFAFRLAASVPPEEIRRRLSTLGDVVEVVVGGGAPMPVAGRQVRVEQGRLDTLVVLSGELVIARNRLAAVIERRRDPELDAACERTVRLVGEVQEQVLRTRMAPVGEVFERFPRAVRDLAHQLGKQVRLEVEGGDIELDRAILDELADPLLHLVRNAVDHGIEGPEEREAAGKPPEGRIRLTASRERNAVVLDVTDDGRGVDRPAVLDRAREQGWMAADADALPDEQLLTVLARPGFSTARAVTGVSGRGVGIDAVVHWVRSMGGATALSSGPGAGTTVSLRLPLTVTIVPALLVGVAGQRYAIPLGFVAETTQIRAPGTKAGFRGMEVPVIELVAGTRSATDGWRPGVILDVAGRHGALAVDTLLGQEDIVVGPLMAPRGTPRWVNGATILADGRAALVVDPAALV